MLAQKFLARSNEPRRHLHLHPLEHLSHKKNIDAVCAQIAQKEACINILCLSQCTVSVGQETDEGMHADASLVLHSRTRLNLNLLFPLRAARGLGCVVSIFTGTKEDPLTTTELQMRSVKNPLKARGQVASAVTLLLEDAGKRAKGKLRAYVSGVCGYEYCARSRGFGQGGGQGGGEGVRAVAVCARGGEWGEESVVVHEWGCSLVQLGERRRTWKSQLGRMGGWGARLLYRSSATCGHRRKMCGSGPRFEKSSCG